jgi:uncharacterized membrane protein
MTAVIVAVILILIVIAIAASVMMVRRPAATPPPEPHPPPPANYAAEREQAESIGADLLSRRVQLDARRGALGGDAGIDAEFDRLQEKLHSGEISEAQFEQEKIRLLGG